MKEVVSRAVEVFEARFGEAPEVVVRAPGRVNLIGEHTDYNDGFVFPAAIDRWVVFAAGARMDKKAVIWSVAHEEKGEFAVDEAPDRTGYWPDYCKGVVLEFQKLGNTLCGFNAVLVGDVPVGAGLSSSAAVEMATGKGLLELNGLEMSGPELALLGQRAENQFVGVNCGIMDQFISANGKANHALLLDCRDLTFEPVPLPGESVRIVICHSGVKRGLTGSAYNERRTACEEGVYELGCALGRELRALRDVTAEELETYRQRLSDTVYRRCRHVVGEIERTRQAAALLKGGDVAGFGVLMAASHASLREDYEVSGRELDLLVEIASEVPGVLGARLTGAGFGGCTVNLVEVDAVEQLTAAVQARYPQETGLTPNVYVCSAVNGVERLAKEAG